MKYSNFVRPASSIENSTSCVSKISGTEAKKLYLEEIGGDSEHNLPRNCHVTACRDSKQTKPKVQISDRDLFLIVQNNEVNTLRQILDGSPNKIHTVDSYGWSLLMIACQANSVETAQELLKRGIDVSVRDKAGNSARSLVIMNKNLVLADILLNNRNNEKAVPKAYKHKQVIKNEDYKCEICEGKIYPDKNEHLSSTVHNINASKGKKIRANYVIPASNRGYQIMLKVGWDKESGLGPEGTGKQYPIKTVQKEDRKGLGHEKRKIEGQQEDTVRHKNRKLLNREYQYSRKMEINFRRQFY